MENTNSFSPREKEVIGLLLEGSSNKQIALALSISTSTVEFHLRNIYHELQVGTRTEAVLKLTQYHLGKSIGPAGTENLGESIVGGLAKPADNDVRTILWRLPLKTFFYLTAGLLTALLVVVFLSARLPAKNVPIPPAVENNPGLPTASINASPTPGAGGCLAVQQIDFCVRGVAQTRDFFYIMLEIQAPPGVQADGLGFMSTALNSGRIPSLRDEHGNENKIADNGASLVIFPGAGEQTFLQTLKFPALMAGTKQVTLSFPAVGFFVPHRSSFELDLGENPQPGREIPLDQELNIQGQVIHLSKAVLSGNAGGSLWVDIWSNPVELDGSLAALMPRLGIPAGTGMGTGFGSKLILPGSAYHAFAGLSRPGKNPVSGLIKIPVEGASVYYEGNFEIPFSIPDGTVSSQIEPGLEQLAQIAEIRRFTNNPDQEPIFVTFENVNNIWSAMYLTADGSSYWLETRSNRITQFKPGKLAANGAGDKNPQELKEIAEQFAIGNSLKFDQLRDNLAFSTSLTGNLHLFRWEYQKMVIPENSAPFLQITLAGNGDVLEYTNSLDFAAQ